MAFRVLTEEQQRQWAIDGYLVIRNVLGSKVLSQKVDLKGNFTNVDINVLNTGIYLYSLVIDGSTIVTKKFTVRK